MPDTALKRACYVVRFMLADRRALRKYMYRYFGRVGIMGAREGIVTSFSFVVSASLSRRDYERLNFNRSLSKAS